MERRGGVQAVQRTALQCMCHSVQSLPAAPLLRVTKLRAHMRAESRAPTMACTVEAWRCTSRWSPWMTRGHVVGGQPTVPSVQEVVVYRIVGVATLISSSLEHLPRPMRERVQPCTQIRARQRQ